MIAEPQAAPSGAKPQARKSFDVTPLVVGVSGHRDVPEDAEPRLRERFGEIVDRFAQQYPSTKQVVLSGLAAGADVLAAEVALDRDIAVIACLPMAQEEYEKDFTPEEVRRFRAALSRCWDVIVVGNSAKREDNYVAVATYIAYYSALLVAFWDGAPGRGRGGTADVVRLRETGLPIAGAEPGLIHYEPDVGPVFQIVTPRKGQPHPADCFKIHEIYPKRPGLEVEAKKGRTRRKLSGEPAKEEFEQALYNLDRFNRDLAREPVPQTQDQLDAFQKRTGAVANKLQKWAVGSLRSLYVVAAIAGAAQLAAAPPVVAEVDAGIGQGVKIGLLVVAFLWFVVARKKDFENRYQDYRAIAEGLRVQQAWCCAGLRNRLVDASYLQMQQSELQWIRLALRTIYLVSGAFRPDAADSFQNKNCQEWIGGQLKYYRDSAQREQKKEQSAGRITGLLLGLGGAFAGLAVFLTLLVGGIPAAVPLGPVGSVHLLKATGCSQSSQIAAGKPRKTCTKDTWSLYGQWPNLETTAVLHTKVVFHKKLVEPWLKYMSTVPLGVFGLLALLLRFYTQQRGHTENTRRYHLMFAVFDAARRRLEQKPDDSAKILGELGHEALSEHADWLILHRERPLHFVGA